MLYALGGKAGFNISVQKPNEDTGRSLAADVLGFGGIVFGSFSGVRLFVLNLMLSSNGLTLMFLCSGHPSQQITIVNSLQIRRA